MKTLNKKEILKIPQMREEGKSNAQIAEILGTTTRTIGYWVKRLKEAGHKLPVKNKGGRKAISL